MPMQIILKEDEHTRVRGIVEAVRSHPAAAAVLDEADSEVSIFWQCDRFGIQRKARLDTTRGGVIADLKTCRDASPQPFARDVASLLYHVQAANYVDGYRTGFGRDPESYLFIAVESEPPHGVADQSANRELTSRSLAG